ncbi:MAG: ABC transporter permease [Nitriliruptoraceae bacterium]|nr:ABC transporter permease [Nitriliruptoraceae bacterium]
MSTTTTTGAGAAITRPDTTTRPPARTGRVLANELREELLAVIREPTTLFFTVAMPVGFFAMFVGLWGTEPEGTTNVAAMMLATFGAFGVIGVALMTPGIGVAEDRERGWLRVKRVSATPLPVTIAAKVLACMPHALGVVGAMSLLALVLAEPGISTVAWLRVLMVLVLGSLPFALVGLAVGFLASPNAATAVLMALYIPSSVASGLWMPLDMLPDALARLAPALPTYHLGQLAVSQLEGRAGLEHAAALLAFAVVAAGGAALAYRRASP